MYTLTVHEQPWSLLVFRPSARLMGKWIIRWQMWQGSSCFRGCAGAWGELWAQLKLCWDVLWSWCHSLHISSRRCHSVLQWLQPCAGHPPGEREEGLCWGLSFVSRPLRIGEAESAWVLIILTGDSWKSYVLWIMYSFQILCWTATTASNFSVLEMRCSFLSVGAARWASQRASWIKETHKRIVLHLATASSSVRRRSVTLCHTQLSYTHTHNSVTHTHTCVAGTYGTGLAGVDRLDRGNIVRHCHTTLSHRSLSHTTSSHTTLSHTQTTLSHTHYCVTRNNVTCRLVLSLCSYIHQRCSLVDTWQRVYRVEQCWT